MRYIRSFRLSVLFLFIANLLSISLAQPDPDSMIHKIFMAIHQDDVDAMKSLTLLSDFRDNINEVVDRSGQTPLMRAVLQGKSPDIVRTIMKFGADPTIGEKDGYTPLHGIGFQGRYELAPILVSEFGLDPNDKHVDGFTPLHRACWGYEDRHTTTAKILLELGADPYEPMCTQQYPDCILPVDATNNEETKRVLRSHMTKGTHNEKEL